MVLDGDQLQPYFDAIELEGNAGQPMDEEGVEEAKVRKSSKQSRTRVKS